MKKGILISALGLAAIVLSGCQNTQTGVGGSAPTNSNTTQIQRSAVKTRITVDLNGGQLKGSGDTTKTFEVRFSTMWQWIENDVATQELPKKDDINYTGHELKWYSLDPKGDEAISDTYAFVEDTTIYAHYDLEEGREDWANVIWHNDDGTILNTEKYIFGETPYYHGETPRASKDPDLKAFSGWDPHLEPIPETQGSHPTYEYTARYINLEVEWKVTFHYNYTEGGREKTTEQLVHDGQKATDPEPTRTGYDFFGWYLNPRFEDTPYDFDAEVHADLDLYAKWDDAKVIIIFDANGGVFPPKSQTSMEVKYGTTFGTIKHQIPIVSKKGYGDVDYWTLNSGSAPIEDGYKFLQSTTIFAYYGDPSEYYDITFLADGGTWSNDKTDNVVLNVLFGSVPDLEELTLSKNDNGVISSAVNWKEVGTESSGLKPVSGDTTYTPIWQESGYEITFDANGGYFGNDHTITQKVVQTEKNKIPTCETPKRDISGTTIYTFDGWEPTIRTATEPATYHAKWKETEDKVTINFNANGGSLVGSESLSVLRRTTWGNVANKPSATNTGYKFIGWGASADATEPIAASYAFENDYTTLYAIFSEQEFEITFNSGGGTWSDGSTGSKTVKVKTNKVPSPGLALTKKEDGKIFAADNWQESGSSDVGVKPAIENTSYNPVWSDNPSAYEITFNANGGKFRDDSTTRTVITNAGQLPSCETPTRQSATKGEVWVFKGWSPDIEKATSVKTYDAQWEISIDNVTVSFDSNGGTLTGDAIKMVARYTKFSEFKDDFSASKEGYDFRGWGLSKDATNPISDSYEFNEDTTSLFAIYGKKQWTITFNNDGGTWVNGGSAPISKTVNSGEVADPSDTLTKHTNDGITSTSSGWKDSSGVSGVKPAVSNASYYPIWTAQAYDITFDAGEGYFDNNPATKRKVVVTPINQLPTCVNPVRDHDQTYTYEFDGWNETIVLATGVATYTAKWKAIPIIQKWTITFDENGGSEVADQEIANNEYAMEPRTTWSKHEFKGWSTQEIDPNLEHLFNFAETPITSSFILYAQWEEIPDSYEITFNSNGGSAVPSQTVVSGNYVIEPATPTKDGCVFKGWLTIDGGGAQALYNFATPVESSFTLYAWWEEAIPTFTIEFNAQGGIPTPVPQTVQRDEKLIEPAAPTKEGYVFQGWFTQNEGGEKFDFGTQITSGFTLYAQWKAETKYFEVSFDTQGGSANPATQTIEDGKTAIEPRAPTKEGFIFKGWSIYTSIESDDQLFDFTTSIKGKTDLYAIWDKEPEPDVFHTVEFNSNGGSYTPKEQTVKHDTTLIEPAAPGAPQEGYVFDCWSTSNEQSYSPFNFSTPITEDNVVLYAHYKLAPVVQTFKVQFLDKDTESPLIAEQIVVSGKTAIEPKDPTKDGFIFSGWSTSKTEYIQFDFATQITKDTPLYAFWTDAPGPVETVTVTFNSQGGSEVAPQTVVKGEKVIEPKSPTLEGKVFVGWSKNQSDPDLESLFNFNEGVNDSIEIYAQWIDEPTPPTPTTGSILGFTSLDDTKTYKIRPEGSDTAYDSGTMTEFGEEIYSFTFEENKPDISQLYVYINNEYATPGSGLYTYDEESGVLTVDESAGTTYKINIIIDYQLVPTDTTEVAIYAEKDGGWIEGLQAKRQSGKTEKQINRFEWADYTGVTADPIIGLQLKANGGKYPSDSSYVVLVVNGIIYTDTSDYYNSSTGYIDISSFAPVSSVAVIIYNYA